MADLIERLSELATSAHNLEALTRPLLEILEEVTGLESTYLTTIDLAAGTQSILYARNIRKIQIPEGLTVAWGDTLCKRALDEGRPFTDNVSDCWGDSEAAAALGIQTYVSTPVYAGEGVLYGTLCAASSDHLKVDDRAARVLKLFAHLIGVQVERERLLTQLLDANTHLAALAATDPLTGLPNRRALLEALRQHLELANRLNTSVFVAFIDLDGFKNINDTHGHAVGDSLLCAIAERLRLAIRPHDIVARYGGDEFAVIGAGPVPGPHMDEALEGFSQRIAQSTVTRFQLLNTTIDYPGCSVGAIAVSPHTLDAVTALELADQAMYRVKQARLAGSPTQRITAVGT